MAHFPPAVAARTFAGALSAARSASVSWRRASCDSRSDLGGCWTKNDETIWGFNQLVVWNTFYFSILMGLLVDY